MGETFVGINDRFYLSIVCPLRLTVRPSSLACAKNWVDAGDHVDLAYVDRRCANCLITRPLAPQRYFRREQLGRDFGGTGHYVGAFGYAGVETAKRPLARVA